MKRIIPRLAIAVALAGATAHAEVKTETITAEQVGVMIAPGGEVKRIKLSMTDATFEDIVAEFNKISGVALQVDQAPQRNAGPSIIYDVSIDAATMPAALDQLARALHVGIANNGDSMRIGANYQEGYRSNEGFEMSGPAGVTVTGVSLQRSLGAGGQRSSSLAVSITVQPGPHGLCGTPRIKVLEATDEQGRAIQAEPQQENDTSRQRMRHGIGVSAPLKILDPAPKRLAKFSAQVSYGIPKTFQRLTVTEFPETPVDCEIAGVKVQIGPPVKEGENWTMKVRTPSTRNGNPPLDVFQEMQFIKVFGPDGQPLRVLNRGGRNDGQWMEANAQIVPMGPRKPDQPMPRPSSLVWEALKDIETIQQTVEATDLQIP